MKVLNIVESAYRATLEEQDDTVIWINHAMKGAGADLAVLLQHNAVYYAVKGQDASGLQFGARAQRQPPRLAEDVVKLIGKGVTVYIVDDDVAERGLEKNELIDGLSSVSRSALPKLLGDYDQIWHW
jgi:sulfur relay (sulfurtransferase) DsrF/TusC family protein